MVRPKVTIIVVAHDGGEYLERTLEAVARQTFTAHETIVVDTGVTSRVTGSPSGSGPTQHIAAPSKLSFGGAAWHATRTIATPTGDHEWLWLLNADNAPADNALEMLVHAVEVSPSVVVAGPKLMQWADPGYIYSFGETMTPLGTSVEVAEPELDQSQYDRLSDVMGVSSSGMLVRHQVWEQLGGFDPGLPATDDGLDFCVRARLAGHRVTLVPAAKVLSAGRRAPGSKMLGPRASRGKRARVARSAQLHRRLVYSPAVATPLHWLSLLPLALVRAIGQLLRKRPGSVIGEFVAAIGAALAIPSVIRARGRLARARTVSWTAIDSLRLPWAEVRRRRGLARDDAAIIKRAGRHELRFFTGGGAWAVVIAALVGLALHIPLIGASSLNGGGLLPLGSIGEVWGQVGYGWRSVDAGFVGVADPFSWVLALLGTLTFWSPSLSIVLLFLAAFPIATAGAWLAAARLTPKPTLRVVAAVLWTLAPPFLISLDQGRIGAVLVHLLLPWLVFAALSARRSWSASATTALLAAGVAASAPSLLPALTAIWLVSVVIFAGAGKHGRGWHRLLPLPLPVAVLFLPLAAQQIVRGNPLGALADPGITLAPAPLSSGFLPPQVSTTLHLVIGVPGGSDTGWQGVLDALGLGAIAPGLVIGALLLPLLVVGIAAPFLRGTPKAIASLGMAGLGFVTAVAASRIAVASIGADAVTLWPGPGLSLYWMGMLAAAVLTLGANEAVAARALRGLLGTIAVLGVVVAAVPMLGASAFGTALVGSGGRGLPALVDAQAVGDPTIGTLTIAAQTSSGVQVGLERGNGETLDQQSTLASTTGPERFGSNALLVELAGNLSSTSGYDFSAAFGELRIGFVLLSPAAPGATAMHDRAAAALDGNALLTPITRTTEGSLWRFTGLDAGLPTSAPNGPDNLATSTGVFILSAQALVLLLTLLLALPTSDLADRMRPEREARRGSGLRGARAAAGTAQTVRPTGWDAPIRPITAPVPTSAPEPVRRTPPIINAYDPVDTGEFQFTPINLAKGRRGE